MWSGEEGFAGGVDGGNVTDSTSGAGDSSSEAEGRAEDERRRKPGGWKNRKVDKDKISLKDFRNPWNFFNIFLTSEEEAHAWCRKEGLLATSLPCDKCDGELTLRKRKGFVANESFRCNKNTSHETQTRRYSFFENSKLPVNDIMLFTKSYLENNSLRQCATFAQLELSASNTVKVDYRLPVTCSDFNSTTVNSLGLDFIDLLPVTLSISYPFLNVVSNTDFYAICSHYYHFSKRLMMVLWLLLSFPVEPHPPAWEQVVLITWYSSIEQE